MASITIEIPDDLARLLAHSRLAGRPVADQVQMALAIQLLQEGVISAGRAAEIAGEPRAQFELLLGQMGIPPVHYDAEDFRREQQALERARRLDR